VTEIHVLDKSGATKASSRASKRENFVRIAEKRTRNAIKAIRIIGKLGNKNAYDYTEADVKKISSALNKEIETMRSRMSQTGSKEAVDFSL
jgi:ribosomal protein L7/L12